VAAPLQLAATAASLYGLWALCPRIPITDGQNRQKDRHYNQVIYCVFHLYRRQMRKSPSLNTVLQLLLYILVASGLTLLKN